MATLTDVISAMIAEAETDGDPVIVIVVGKDGLKIKTTIPAEALAGALVIIANDISGRESEMVSRRVEIPARH